MLSPHSLSLSVPSVCVSVLSVNMSLSHACVLPRTRTCASSAPRTCASSAPQGAQQMARGMDWLLELVEHSDNTILPAVEKTSPASASEQMPAVKKSPPASASEQMHIAIPARWVGQVEPDWQRELVYVLHGGCRVAEGLPVTETCPFSMQVLGIVREMGLPHRCVTIDLGNKPEWFKSKFKSGTTPCVWYNGEVVEDSSVILGWLQRMFPQEGKRVFVEEVAAMDRPVMVMVMGTMGPVLQDKTGDKQLQEKTRGEWATALLPLETALEEHGTLGVGGAISAGDYKAAAMVFLMEVLSAFLPGVLKDMEVLATYPRIAKWMESSMRGRMVAVGAPMREMRLAISQSPYMKDKMPGLVVSAELLAARERFLQEQQGQMVDGVPHRLATATGETSQVDQVEPEWQTDVVYLLHGGYRVAEGTPVVAICTFSNMVMAVMQQMGIPMASITVDLDDRPEWFTRKCKAGQTPAVVYGGEVVEDSAVILEWLPRTFPEEAKRVFLEEVGGIDKPVMAMVMSAMSPVLQDTTNDAAVQRAAASAWASALSPLEAALERHGRLGIGGAVSVGDLKAAAVVHLIDVISPFLPGALKSMDVFASYPNVAKWMDEGMRGRIVAVSSSLRLSRLAVTQSKGLKRKMPGLCIDAEVVADRARYLEEIKYAVRAQVSTQEQRQCVDSGKRMPVADDPAHGHHADVQGLGDDMPPRRNPLPSWSVPRWMVEAKLLPAEAQALHREMQSHDVDLLLLHLFDEASWLQMVVLLPALSSFASPLPSLLFCLRVCEKESL